MSKKYSIIIELKSESEALDKIDEVRQLFMCRNPFDEPHIYYTETVPSYSDDSPEDKFKTFNVTGL